MDSVSFSDDSPVKKFASHLKYKITINNQSILVDGMTAKTVRDAFSGPIIKYPIEINGVSFDNRHAVLIAQISTSTLLIEQVL